VAVFQDEPWRLPSGRRRRTFSPPSSSRARSGLILALLPTPLYDTYVQAPRLWGLAPLEDQQLGGTLMAVSEAIVFFGLLATSSCASWPKRTRDTVTAMLDARVARLADELIPAGDGLPSAARPTRRASGSPARSRRDPTSWRPSSARSRHERAGARSDRPRGVRRPHDGRRGATR
jgi:hypothetical protein